MARETVCRRCGQRAMYAKDARTMAVTDKLVCWGCGGIIEALGVDSSERCRCSGNVKLQRFGVEVDKGVDEGHELALGETASGSRPSVAALATQAAAARRTSPPRRPSGRKLEKRMLEAFGT